MLTPLIAQFRSCGRVHLSLPALGQEVAWPQPKCRGGSHGQPCTPGCLWREVGGTLLQPPECSGEILTYLCLKIFVMTCQGARRGAAR